MEDAYVVAIFTAPIAGAPPESRSEVHAVPGCGLEGDRYFKPPDAPADAPDDARGPRKEAQDITLIEIEVIEDLKHTQGLDVSPADARRNIVTRGVRLNDLVGHEFSLGQVTLRGHSLCQPCAHLEKATGQAGLLKALVNRGGLRAQILTEGMVRVGDRLRIP